MPRSTLRLGAKSRSCGRSRGAASHSATASGSHARVGHLALARRRGCWHGRRSSIRHIGHWCVKAHPDEPAAHGGAPALPAGRASAPGLVWLGAPPGHALPQPCSHGARALAALAGHTARGVAALGLSAAASAVTALRRPRWLQHYEVAIRYTLKAQNLVPPIQRQPGRRLPQGGAQPRSFAGPLCPRSHPA